MKHYEEQLKDMGMFNLQLAMERYNTSLQISEWYLFIYLFHTFYRKKYKAEKQNKKRNIRKPTKTNIQLNKTHTKNKKGKTR